MQEIDEILQTGGFKVKEWIFSGTPKETDVQTFQEQEEKVLGLCWKPTDDMLYYKVNFASNQRRLTKRSVLSQMSKLFDSIGFAAAVVIKTKIAMQKLWQLGLGWDTVLPNDEEDRWIKLFDELNKLNDISFARCLTPEHVLEKSQLIVFCDASNEAFGACAYLRWKINDDNFEMKFLAAKSRVAPLKSLTIPRLELQAAVIGARLSSCLKEAMRLELANSVFMTDSLIVLHWIKGSAKKYKHFVANRVSEIHVYSDPDEWKFIAGTHNPADDISRGITVDKLKNRWYNGPKFMTLPDNQWPEMKEDFDPDENVRENMKEEKSVLSVKIQEEVIEAKNFSSLRKLIRITAYVLRFVAAARQKFISEGEKDVELTVSELEAARCTG